MPERINRLQPDRTLYLRGFDSFAAAASIHHASSSGFQISGIFRDPADFAVAVLYDADNGFEHPSIRYLPDFDFAGLVLNFDLLYSDSVQPIDSPKYNWIDWATLDCIREDGSIAGIPLWDNCMLVDPAFPAASAAFNVLATGGQPGDRLTLSYQNLDFDYTVPGGLNGSATYFAQAAGTSASISVGSTVYGYTLTAAQDGPAIAANLASLAAADPLVQFTPSGNTLTFDSKVNTGDAVSVSGYDLWLITDPPNVLIASNFASQINGCNWLEANTTHGLLASAAAGALTITAARYGTVSVDQKSVTWVSGTKFPGIVAGDTIFIGGQAYVVAGIQSPMQLTLTTAAVSASSAPYLAPRGGRDGNMIELCSVAGSPATLAFDRSQIQLIGGSSAVTWNCTIDFTALKIDRLRQCWLSFAPSLANGSAYTASEWHATFSNWQLTDPNSIAPLQIAGPGSCRIEESSSACAFTGNWNVEAGYYSKYFAAAAKLVDESITVTYTCQFTHNLYMGTSLDGAIAPAAGLLLVTDTLYNPSFNGNLYSNRGVAGIRLDADTETFLDCRMNTAGSELVTRRLLRSAVVPGKHTVVIRVAEAGSVYFDFLEAAVLSDLPDAMIQRTNVSPALDFDTDQTYKVSPSRLLWMLNKLGYAGPLNEYLGVFWWNERKRVGGFVSSAQVTFGGTFAPGDSITLGFDLPTGSQLTKSAFATDTPASIAAYFAAYINGSSTSSWASAVAGVLTINGRSPALPYNLGLSVSNTSALGTAVITALNANGSSPTAWAIDDTISPSLNRAARDWHADFYSQCFDLGLQVVTACSMELVDPPDGYAALYPDGSAVLTDTGFGSLKSTQCAPGSSKMLAYQKAVYRNLAQLQSAAGLIPSVQYGEFLWWYFSGASGMAYYDSETKAAAQAALGRALHVFTAPNDDPSVNTSADAIFLRSRLRDHVAALVADIRSAYPAVTCELLWPYDVNYPTPSASGGGQLNRFVNLPVEWQSQPSSGFDRMKVEALAFATSLRNLNLAREAIELFPSFGWDRRAVHYLVPVFGSATPWIRELALVWSAGLRTAHFWALDHFCLYNLEMPEPPLERRSVSKTR